METHEEVTAVAYILIVVFSAMHVSRDCKRIGERPFWNVTGTLLLWPFFYMVGWLWIWPGSLRRWIFGGSIDDLVQAKALRRISRRRFSA